MVDVIVHFESFCLSSGDFCFTSWSTVNSMIHKYIIYISNYYDFIRNVLKV